MASERSKAAWDRFRAWRLRRAEMALADAEHYYWKWVNPAKWSGTPPSEDARFKRKIDGLRRRVVALGGEADV